MSRFHPFEVLAAALSEEWFSEIRATEDQGRDPVDRLQFHDLGAVQRALRALYPPGEEGPATIAQYETLLYTTYRFWRAGRHTLVPGREALIGASAPSHPPAVPNGACYIQLPEHFFWARIDEAAAPEPLDGMFLVAGPDNREITVLAVLGLRPERGGFSQVALTVPPEDLTRAESFARRPPFAPVLEGGERAGVKSLVSEAELLYLAHLAVAEVAE